MNQLPVNTENSINDIAFNKKTISSLPAFFMAHFYMLIKAKMNKNSTDKREIFSGWLQDIDGIANHPGISVVMYAGVREVTEGDLLKVIYTRGHIKDDSGKLIDPFSVAVSNQEGNLSSCEMWNIFKQEVAKQLESIMHQKSLPSS